jgi:hypothetical protein
LRCRRIVPREGAKALVEATQSRDTRSTREFDLIVIVRTRLRVRWNVCAEGTSYGYLTDATAMPLLVTKLHKMRISSNENKKR